MVSAGTPTMNFMYCAVSTGPGISSSETRSWPCFQLGQSVTAESPPQSLARGNVQRQGRLSQILVLQHKLLGGMAFACLPFTSLIVQVKDLSDLGRKRECGRKCNPGKWAHADTESVQHP